MSNQIKLSPKEVSRRGREIYERDIRLKVEKDYDGQFLVVDILTGAYEIAGSKARSESVTVTCEIDPTFALDAHS